MRKSISQPFRRIVWPLAVAETIVWAGMLYVFPALLPTWERDLGWSIIELSGAFTLSLIVSAVMAPAAGRLIDRGYGRATLTGGALLGAGMLVLLSQVNEIWQFYLVWFCLGVANAGALYEACFAFLTRAMGADAKRAITLVTLVAGFAGTLSFPSASTLADLYGWRAAVIVFAGVIVAVAVPLMWSSGSHAESHAAGHLAPASGKTSQAAWVTRTATFWLLALSFCLISIDHGIVITHVLPLLNDRGVQADAAVLAASMIGPMQVAGRLAMMAAERYASTLILAIACYFSMGLAAAALYGTGWASGLVVVFVICQGAGVGVMSILRPVLIAECLGRRDFGVISGLIAVPTMIGYAFSPSIAALLREVGGYDLVLLLAILAMAVATVALLAAWRGAAARTSVAKPREGSEI